MNGLGGREDLLTEPLQHVMGTQSDECLPGEKEDSLTQPFQRVMGT
jgi:hypothetical protein